MPLAWRCSRGKESGEEALLYERSWVTGRSAAVFCRWRCVIPRRRPGVCATRLNRGVLRHTLLYGRVALPSAQTDRESPSYHFHPG